MITAGEALKKMRHNTGTLSIFLFLLASCNEGGVSPDSRFEFYPLARGNTWIYKRVPVLGNGDSLFSETVAFETTINELEWFVVLSTLEPGSRVTYCRDGIDGFRVLTGIPLAISSLLYKYPGHVNESYVVFPPDDTMRITATQATIATEAGTFKCMVYQRQLFLVTLEGNALTLYDDTYIAPRIGKVKEEIYSYDSTMTKQVSGFELVQYSLR